MSLPHPDKTFFILRSLIYHPDDLIQLGQVITDPRTPYIRLAPPVPLTDPLKARIAKSSNWSLTLNEVDEKSIGVFAHIIKILSAEAGGSTSQVEVLKRRGAVLETQYFEISEDPTYVKRTSQVEVIRDELQKLRSSGKTLYMVTGIKIVRWPGEALHEQTDSATAEGKASAILDPEGRVEGGFDARTHTSNATITAETPDTSYVVAYRLRRLRVSWIQRRLDLREEQGGAEMSGVGRWSTNDEESFTVEDDPDCWEIEDASADFKDFGPSLAMKDGKMEAIDEEDSSTCLVIRAA
ncbi:hypothetical protein INS49_002475 [Diaporthe citri]|uniref:uncharacterized protein n=1 Tax=Diaporthe citri TaxID=83186 RepID=UPI001C7EE75D|nr:uncharacterized protein INS49_002475 [Diaporthe citri]KAG6368272.1 hypothetical protein INS49_002475 [Diaporthe citri]